MSRIAIVAPSILPRDAIGHDILHSWRILRDCGHEVELFSANWGRSDPRSQEDLSVRDFLDEDPSAVLILHHAIGWAPAVRLMTEAKCHRLLRYHNVTPAYFYDPLNADYAELCRLGRRQLHQLIRLPCDLYLADSPFNRNDLLAAGADPDRIAVSSPFNDIERLLRTTADPRILRDCGDGRVNLLFVGRRAPNKGHRFLIETFALYQRYFNPHCRLLLVGKGDAATAAYTTALRQRVRELRLQGCVAFIEDASEAELRAYYETATVYVTASEHEGYCVPLVEAMALGVPIVALDTTAVPGTVGDAGLIWEQADPFLFAQSVESAIGEDRLRRRLIERGRQRYAAHFTNAQIERTFRTALEPLLKRHSGLTPARVKCYTPCR